MNRDRPIILILGPTAGGKTGLAVELALRLPGGGECIGADSMQIYRGMDIGTAKPTADERARVPHHLLDLVDPGDDGFTVDHWLRLAELTIADIRSRSRWPIVVGGTNLYIKALLEGLFEGPQPDPGRREELDTRPSEQLHAHLRTIDPEAAERIHPNDRRRVIRAIEVFEQSGHPISTLQQQWNRSRIRSDCLIIGLDFPVPLINRRINARVKAMVDAGFVEEVRHLYEERRLGRQARAALGYRQIIGALEGRMPLEDAIEQIKIRTRRYAKQQRTWLRRFQTMPRSQWIRIRHEDDFIDVDALLKWILDTSASQSASPSDENGAT